MESKISLVIPVRDEELSIAVLLGSISAQTRLPDEVVFVDAGSTDATRDIIKAHNDTRLNVKILSIGAAYPGVARNAGVRQARNQTIAFTDGGIELDKDWLKELSSSMVKDASADIVYGNYVPRADTFFKQCLSMAIVPPPKVAGDGMMRTRFIASSLLKKPLWEAVGGFPDLRAAEDRIFMERIEKGGYRSEYNPKATVIWDIPGDLKSVFGRFYSYSYHDLMAARTKDWHLPVLRMYAATLAFICAGFLVSPLFFLLPIAGFALRTARKIFINRNEPYFTFMHVPSYLLLVGFLVFFIDLAMFSGWARYLKSAGHMAAKSHA